MCKGWLFDKMPIWVQTTDFITQDTVCCFFIHIWCQYLQVFWVKALYIYIIYKDFFPVKMLSADFIICFFDLFKLEGASESCSGHGDTQGGDSGLKYHSRMYQYIP